MDALFRRYPMIRFFVLITFLVGNLSAENSPALRAPQVLTDTLNSVVSSLDSRFREISGAIQKVSADRAYAVLNGGIWKAGDKVIVSRLGEWVGEGASRTRLSEALGSYDVILVRGQVAHLRGDMSILKAGDVGMKREPLLRAVVMPARQVNCDAPEITALLMDKLISTLQAAGTFKILNRDNLQDLIKEVEFGASGLVDESSAKKLGLLYGADVLIFPVLIGAFDGPSLACKVVSAESAVVVGGTLQKIKI